MRGSERRRLHPLKVRGTTFAWGTRTYVMGIINVTPDSFSGDGIDRDVAAAVEQAKAFVEAGCDILDIGGESTRPGHTPVDVETEAARVLPVVSAIRSAVAAPISIDTFKPQIAAAALDAGADIINCVWGAVPKIIEIAAQRRAPLVVMHNRASPDYGGDCVLEIIASLATSIADARRSGVDPDRIIVDPGIGFGKTADHNVEILARLPEFASFLPHPLLVGTSRKSFIGKITGLPVDQRIMGTAATVTIAIGGGADIVRVHDVAAMMPVVDVADAVYRVGAARAARERAQAPRPSST